MKNFGEKLKRCLELYNVTQTQLANATGITKCSISRYIKGTKSPNLEKAMKIAKFFGLKIEYFYDVEQEQITFFRIKEVLKENLKELDKNKKEELLKLIKEEIK